MLGSRFKLIGSIFLGALVFMVLFLSSSPAVVLVAKKQQPTNFELVVIAISGGSKMQYEFFRVWQRVIAENVRGLGVKIIHVRFSNGIENVGVWDDLQHNLLDIVYDGMDTYYPGILNQTLLSMKYVREHFSFKHVLVTNLSTFWDFPKLLKHLRGKRFQSSRPLYAGFRMPNPIPELPENLRMISGTGILLNQRSVELVLSTKVDWDMVNDVFIKHALKDLKEVTWSQCWFDPLYGDTSSYDQVKDNVKWPLPCEAGNFQYRIKTGNELLDLRLWNLLMKHVYGYGGGA